MSNFNPVDMSFHVPWDVCCNNLELEVVLNYTENNYIVQCKVDLSSWYTCILSFRYLLSSQESTEFIWTFQKHSVYSFDNDASHSYSNDRYVVFFSIYSTFISFFN